MYICKSTQIKLYIYIYMHAYTHNDRTIPQASVVVRFFDQASKALVDLVEELQKVWVSGDGVTHLRSL